jgi:hypothetical protein
VSRPHPRGTPSILPTSTDRTVDRPIEQYRGYHRDCPDIHDYIEADNNEFSGLVRGFLEKREEIRLEGLTG